MKSTIPPLQKLEQSENTFTSYTFTYIHIFYRFPAKICVNVYWDSVKNGRRGPPWEEAFTHLHKWKKCVLQSTTTHQHLNARRPPVHHTIPQHHHLISSSIPFGSYPFLCSVMATQTPRGENTMTIVPENTMTIVPLFASHHGISGKHKYEYNHRKISRKFLCKRILGKFHCIFYAFTQIGYV